MLDSDGARESAVGWGIMLQTGRSTIVCIWLKEVQTTIQLLQSLVAICLLYKKKCKSNVQD
jgi:hypothetical protein